MLSPLTGAFEITYERNLNKKSSLGVSVFTVFNNGKLHGDENYQITTYYRRYFGKKFASGFFAEGFGMLNSLDGKRIYDINDNSIITKDPDVIDLVLGIGFGSKWVTKKGFIFEANIGAGKPLFNADKTDHDHVFKFGVNFGYKF